MVLKILDTGRCAEDVSSTVGETSTNYVLALPQPRQRRHRASSFASASPSAVVAIFFNENVSKTPDKSDFSYN